MTGNPLKQPCPFRMLFPSMFEASALWWGGHEKINGETRPAEGSGQPGECVKPSFQASLPGFPAYFQLSCQDGTSLFWAGPILGWSCSSRKVDFFIFFFYTGGWIFNGTICCTSHFNLKTTKNVSRHCFFAKGRCYSNVNPNYSKFGFGGCGQHHCRF